MSKTTNVTRLNEFSDAVKKGGKLAERYATKHRDSTVTINNGLPILKCVKLSRRDHHIEAVSTNLQEFVLGACYCNTRNMCELPESGEHWDICIPFDPLNDWLRALPKNKGQELTITVNMRQKTLSVHYVNGITMTATFKGIDSLEFPVVDSSRIV